MFKKIFIGALLLIVLGAGAVAVYNTSQAASAQAAAPAAAAIAANPQINLNAQGGGNGAANGNGAGNTQNQTVQQPAAVHTLPAPTDLSDAEAEGLLYMREEEKLAHDVYVTLYQTWGLPIFDNVAQSEQQHSDSIKALLDIYALDDPASSELGVFTNPDLQGLYNDLVARGGASVAEAIKVGAAIEEIDILDLQARLAQTDNADIVQIYNNLLRGSENHLRSYVRTLQTQTGETYQPQYLSQEAYQAIMAVTNGNGQGGPGGKGNGNGGNGGGGGRK